MFNFFRRSQSKHYKFLHICGNLYFRQNQDIVVVKGHGRSASTEICGPGHAAPNGVGIKQIAYALALIEGAIAIADVPLAAGAMGSRIGLN